MRHPATRTILATALFAAFLGGCATTVDMGPGYYRYDSRLTSQAAPAIVYQEPTVVYREPTVVYREPAVVYREPAVVYREPAVVYRAPTVVYQETTPGYYYHDHGQ